MPARNRNQDVALLLSNITKLLALKGEDPFRIRAYTEAAMTIGGMEDDVEELHRQGRLAEVPGMGTSIAAKVAEYLETGRSEYYDELRRETGVAAPDLLDVPSIGPTRARLVFEHLGIRSIADLERAAREQRLRALPGFGPRLERKIAEEAAEVARGRLRRLLGARTPAA